jgi:integrase
LAVQFFKPAILNKRQDEQLLASLLVIIAVCAEGVHCLYILIDPAEGGPCPLSSQPVLKSHFGSVKAYTRHTASCSHRRAKDYNSCACPKWLYIRRHGEKSKRLTLNTHSWEDAQRIASAKLRAMDPDIAAAQAVTERHKRKLVKVADACELFLKKIEREKGKQGAHEQYSVAVHHLRDWADRLRIDYIQDITTLMLERWYSEKPWSGFKATTRRQGWINVRTIFKFWFERDLIERNPVLPVKPVKRPVDHVQGPYSEQQITAVLQQADAEGDLRLRAFVQHLLYVGCDVIDAVLFHAKRIEDVAIDGETIHIYRYKRKKTGVQAIVRLSTEVAQMLRTVPRPLEGPEGMPFRDPRLQANSNRSEWSKRVIAVLHKAGVRWVDLPADDEGRMRRKQANCKQFRHTAAVRWLCEGQMPEDVAKMLGHVNADMVRKYYAPWVPDLEEAYLRRIVRMQRRSISR